MRTRFALAYTDTNTHSHMLLHTHTHTDKPADTQQLRAEQYGLQKSGLRRADLDRAKPKWSYHIYADDDACARTNTRTNVMDICFICTRVGVAKRTRACVCV